MERLSLPISPIESNRIEELILTGTQGNPKDPKSPQKKVHQSTVVVTYSTVYTVLYACNHPIATYSHL